MYKYNQFGECIYSITIFLYIIFSFIWSSCNVYIFLKSHLLHFNNSSVNCRIKHLNLPNAFLKQPGSSYIMKNNLIFIFLPFLYTVNVKHHIKKSKSAMKNNVLTSFRYNFLIFKKTRLLVFALLVKTILQFEANHQKRNFD